jgi:hypothetical protein
MGTRSAGAGGCFKILSSMPEAKINYLNYLLSRFIKDKDPIVSNNTHGKMQLRTKLLSTFKR